MLVMLSFPTHSHSLSFHLLKSFLNYLINSFYDSSIKSAAKILLYFVRFIPQYFMFFYQCHCGTLVLVVQSLSHVLPLRPHGQQAARFLCPWDSPGKNTEVGCHLLLQETFTTQGLNLGLSSLQADSLPQSHQGSPKIGITFQENCTCLASLSRKIALVWHANRKHGLLRLQQL